MNQTTTSRNALSLTVSLFLTTVLCPTAHAAPTAAQAARDFQNLEYLRMQKVIGEGGTLNQTFTVKNSYSMRREPEGTVLDSGVYIKKEHVLDEQALIHATDADPLAVVIRGTEALLNHLKVLAGTPDLSALDSEFMQKKGSASGRQGYLDICDIRRR